jgi:hypothetical protein
VLTPPLPQTPIATPVATPQPQAPVAVATPVLTPPLPQTPVATPIPKPEPRPPTVATPVLEPPRPTQNPVVVVGQPQPPVVSFNPSLPPVAMPTSGHTHVLVVHSPLSARPVTSGRHVAASAAYSLEFIEPGLQSRTVEVYRTHDAAEEIYKDTIPLDEGGFQIIIVGTRNPDYVD